MVDATISGAGPADAAAIAALHGQLFSPPWTTHEVAELMAHPGAAAFVMRDARLGDVAGYILGRVAADEAELLSIGVAPSHQRRGLARRLLVSLAERVHDMGAVRLYLEVSAVNASAIALYETTGFARIGVRRAYYRQSGRPAEDALLLARDLTPKPQVD